MLEKGEIVEVFVVHLGEHPIKQALDVHEIDQHAELIDLLTNIGDDDRVVVTMKRLARPLVSEQPMGARDSLFYTYFKHRALLYPPAARSKPPLYSVIVVDQNYPGLDRLFREGKCGDDHLVSDLRPQRRRPVEAHYAGTAFA